MVEKAPIASRPGCAFKRAWVCFALLCVAAISLYSVARHLHNRSVFRHFERERASDEARERVQLLINQGASRRALERELNNGRPFLNELDADGFQMVTFEHLETGVHYRFLFEGERLVASRRTNRSPSLPFPPPYRAWVWAEGTRQAVAAAAWPVWALMFLAVWFPWKRLLLAQILVATSVSATLAWLMRPQLSLLPPQQPWSSLAPFWSRSQGTDLLWNTPWLFGLLLLLISLIVLWWVQFRSRPAYPCCRSCGYDLTANVSGICPECGNPAASAGPRDEPLWWLLRISANTVSAICLLLALATLALWARTPNRWDYVDFGNSGSRFFSTVDGLELRVEYGRIWGDVTAGSTRISALNQARTPTRWKLEWSKSRGWGSRFVAAAPHWFVFSAALLPPICWFGWRIARRRRSAHETRTTLDTQDGRRAR